ncbi:MAG: ATP-binding protein [Deltaproteobacteria bacterium]|nr:ATP-binding protein [Deltaproteobacteria bacterium]
MPSDANPSAPHAPWIADRLDVRVAQGRVESAQLAGLVEALAALHAAAGCTPVPASSLAERGALARASVAELAPSLGAAAGACERALEAAVEASGAALAARRDAPRRLHGRLACEEIHVDPAGRAELGAPARSAAGDPCEDVATLALELAARGRADLALRLVGGYAGRTGDFSLYRVLDAYLALAGLLASQRVLAAAAAGADPARAAAARLLAAPAELAAPAREPFVVAVAGGIASGKSTLAARISASCGAPVASADAARAGGLAGLEPEAQQAAYAEMRQRAAEVLASGRPVVVDACFARRVQRDALRSLAGERGAKFLFVECRADAALTRRRLEERARGQGRPARDWLALRERLLASWEPLRELPREQHLVVDTSRDPSLCLPRIERALGRGAPGPHRVRHDFPKRAILHA